MSTTARRFATLSTLIPLALALQTLAATGAHADALHDSFDRMRAHPATPMSAVHPAEPADPLRAALVEPLRDAQVRSAAHAPRADDDAIVGAFARMLAHEPTPLTAAVPAGTDPLVAALIEPLRDGHRVPAGPIYAGIGWAPRR